MRTEDNYRSLRELLDQFGRGGSRRKDIAEGSGLKFEKSRLEIAQAVLDAKKGRGKFDGQLLVRAMTLLFPRNYNSAGRLGCSVCVQQDFRRIEYEVPRIKASIEKLGGSSESNPEAQPIEDAAQELIPEPLPSIHVGQPAYIVTGEAGKAGLLVGIVVQLVPQVLARMLDRIDSMPAVIDPSRIFANLRDAHDQARRLHTMASTLPTATNHEPAPQQESSSNTTEPSLPKKGDTIDNGDIQCRVTKVSTKDGLISLDGEIQTITFAQFHKEWAIVPK